MSHRMEFDNMVGIRVLSGATGDVLSSIEIHNDASDDLLGSGRYIYLNKCVSDPNPWCFILPDGADWATFTWDRKNPWAPYCYRTNNLYNGIFVPGADPHWQPQVGDSLRVGDRWRRFYRWTQLADDFEVKALGLTGWDTDVANMANRYGCITNAVSTIIPQSLVVLPAAVSVKGSKGGTQTPDILEISYFLSVVGVN